MANIMSIMPIHSQIYPTPPIGSPCRVERLFAMIQMAPNLTPDERQLLDKAIFHGANRSAELIDALFFAQALVRETIAECSTLGIPVSKEHIALEDQTKVFRQNSNIRNCGHRLCGLRCEATLRYTTESQIWRAVNLRCGLRKKVCALLAAQQAVARNFKEQVWKAAKAEREAATEVALVRTERCGRDVQPTW